MAMRKKKFIQQALSKPGAKGGLHRSLGVPEGQPIPRAKLQAALAGKYGEKAQKQARFAKILQGVRP